MQIKWTSGQLKIMTSVAEYIAKRSCLEGMNYEGSDQETASF